MNYFAKTSDQLPDKPEEFFATHYTNKIKGLVTTQDLRDRLHELRLAYKKYPEIYRRRLEEMASILKIGIGGFEKKEGKAVEPPPKETPNTLVENVIKELF